MVTCTQVSFICLCCRLHILHYFRINIKISSEINSGIAVTILQIFSYGFQDPFQFGDFCHHLHDTFKNRLEGINRILCHRPADSDTVVIQHKLCNFRKRVGIINARNSSTVIDIWLRCFGHTAVTILCHSITLFRCPHAISAVLHLYSLSGSP